MITFDQFVLLKENNDKDKEVNPATLKYQIGACTVKQYGEKFIVSWVNSNEKNDQLWYDKYTQKLNRAMDFFGKKAKIDKTSRVNDKTQMISFTVE